MGLKRLFFWLKREEQLKFWIRVQQSNWPKHKFVSTFAHSIIYHRYHCDISPRAIIHKSVYFPHPLGIVIGTGCIVKENVMIYQNVTLGKKYANGDLDYPIIEKSAILYPNTCVIGGITIGEGTIVGAGSIVIRNTERNSTYAGVPARRIEC